MVLLSFLLAVLLVIAVVRFFLKVFLERHSVRQAERAVLEEADWMGRTGLPEDIERELPRYLRRELGEFLDQPGGLRAADLRYVGIASDSRGTAHFWQMPERGGEKPYAYVEIDAEGNAKGLGWGDWVPGTALHPEGKE